jgi:hypothetical protein
LRFHVTISARCIAVAFGVLPTIFTPRKGKGRRDDRRAGNRLAGFARRALLLTRDVMVWIDRKFWAPVGLGQLWYELSGSSLNLVQAEIHGHVSPFLWNPIIVAILLCWAFAVLIALGAAILFIFRNRPPRKN